MFIRFKLFGASLSFWGKSIRNSWKCDTINWFHSSTRPWNRGWSICWVTPNKALKSPLNTNRNLSKVLQNSKKAPHGRGVYTNAVACTLPLWCLTYHLFLCLSDALLLYPVVLQSNQKRPTQISFQPSSHFKFLLLHWNNLGLFLPM